MQLNQRIFRLSFLLLGIAMVIMGLAINELSIYALINGARDTNIKAWLDFLNTWLAGVPVPNN